MTDPDPVDFVSAQSFSADYVASPFKRTSAPATVNRPPPMDLNQFLASDPYPMTSPFGPSLSSLDSEERGKEIYSSLAYAQLDIPGLVNMWANKKKSQNYSDALRTRIMFFSDNQTGNK